MCDEIIIIRGKYKYIKMVSIDGIPNGEACYLYQRIDNLKFYISLKSPMVCLSGGNPLFVDDIGKCCEITVSDVLKRKIGNIRLWNKDKGWIHDLSDVLWFYE